MRTLELNSAYDLYVDSLGNIAVQKDELSTIRQTIVNKLSLIKDEDIYDTNNGLNLDIMFGDSVPYKDKVNEIKRVILRYPSVVSVDKIEFTADPKLRVGYFKCYITVTLGADEAQTTVGFGV